MPSSDGTPQFERAEYLHGNAGPACCTCQQPATPQYYQFSGRIFCSACRQQIEQSIQRMHSSGGLAQAALFGLAAAALGAVIFYGVTALTGYEIGLIGVLVGYLVGKAVRKGSGSAGGLQFQMLAIGLTYISITSTYVLGVLRQIHGAGEVPYLKLFGMALVAPVLGGVQNVFGIVIIGIALWQAWKMNRRVDVRFTGPFAAGA